MLFDYGFWNKTDLDRYRWVHDFTKELEKELNMTINYGDIPNPPDNVGAIEIQLAGIPKEDIKVYQQESTLFVDYKGRDKKQRSLKYTLAANRNIDKVTYKDGLLVVTFKDVVKEKKFFDLE